MSRSIRFLTALLGCTALMACGEVPDEDTPAEAVEAPESAPVEASQEMALVASVEVDGGRLVEFYEMGPGQVVVSQAGQMPMAPEFARAELAALRTDEVFRTLVPEGPLPAAIERAALRELDLERPALPTLEQRGVPKRWDAWFQANFCSVNTGFQWCWLNQAAASSFRRNDVFHFNAVALANTGTVRFYMAKYDWWNGTRSLGSWDLNAGWYRTASYTHGGIDDPDVWAGVTNVAGADRYDFAGWGVD
jgi:hypothetical protein